MIDIVVDVKSVEELFGSAKEQMPYAISRAVNKTATDVRDTMRREVLTRFTVRQRSFVVSQFQVSHTSDKRDSSIYAEITVGGAGYKGGTKTRDILSIFEEGGMKTSPDPAFPMAIPSTNIRPTFTASAPRALYPVNLGLRPRRAIAGGYKYPRRHTTSGGIEQLKGSRRTFVLDPLTMQGVKVWGVYQRTGKGKHDVRLLWTYKQRLTVPALLGFQKTAEAVVDATWQENFSAAFDNAMRTAK